MFKVGKRALTAANPNNPAARPYQSGNPFDMSFIYHPVGFWAGVPGSGFDASDVADYGLWRMFSIGPDGLYNALGTSDTTLGWRYDPTNGTVSSGFILRTQKDPIGENFSR